MVNPSTLPWILFCCLYVTCVQQHNQACMLVTYSSCVNGILTLNLGVIMADINKKRSRSHYKTISLSISSSCLLPSQMHGA